MHVIPATSAPPKAGSGKSGDAAAAVVKCGEYLEGLRAEVGKLTGEVGPHWQQQSLISLFFCVTPHRPPLSLINPHFLS